MVRGFPGIVDRIQIRFHVFDGLLRHQGSAGTAH